jgi:hypothetical protein
MAAANLKVFQIRFILLLKEHLPMAQPLSLYAAPTVKYPLPLNHRGSNTIKSDLIITIRKKNPPIAKKLQKIVDSANSVKTKLPEDKDRLIDLVNTHLTLCDEVVKLADELEICKEYKENKAYKDIDDVYYNLNVSLNGYLTELQETIDEGDFCDADEIDSLKEGIEDEIENAKENLAALQKMFPRPDAPQPLSADLKTTYDDIKDDEPSDKKKPDPINARIEIDTALYSMLSKQNSGAAKGRREILSDIVNSANSVKTKLPEDKDRLINLVNTHLTLCEKVAELDDELKNCKEYKENQAYQDIYEEYFDLNDSLNPYLEDLQKIINKREFCDAGEIDSLKEGIEDEIRNANKNLKALQKMFPRLNAPQPLSDEKKSDPISATIEIDSVLYNKLEKRNPAAAKAIADLRSEIGMKFNASSCRADLELKNGINKVINLCIRNAFLLRSPFIRSKERLKRTIAYDEIFDRFSQVISVTDFSRFNIRDERNKFSKILAFTSMKLKQIIVQLEESKRTGLPVWDNNSFTYGIRDSFYRTAEKAEARFQEKLALLDKPFELKDAIDESIFALLISITGAEKKLFKIETKLEKYACKENLLNSEYRYLCDNVVLYRRRLFSELEYLLQQIDERDFNNFKYCPQKQCLYDEFIEPDAQNLFMTTKTISGLLENINRIAQIKIEEHFSVSSGNQSLLPVNLSEYILNRSDVRKAALNMREELIRLANEIEAGNNEEIISLYNKTHNLNLNAKTAREIGNLIREDAKNYYSIEDVLNNINFCSKYCNNAGSLSRVNNFISDLNKNFEEDSYIRDSYINIYLNGNNIGGRNKKIEEAKKILKRSEQLLADLQSASAN